MFLAIHATAGAIIGMHARNPIFALILGFISHFVLDLIPHGDEKIGEEHRQGKGKIKHSFMIGVDILTTIFATLAIIFFNSPFNSWSVAMGIVGGLLPDMLQMTYVYSGHPFFKNFYDLHNAMHYNQGRFTMHLRYGLLFQIGILALILLISV